MIDRDATHSADLSSWVESANAAGTDFPIQNLPFGCFSVGGRQSIGIAIGEQIVDLNLCAQNSDLTAELDGRLREACEGHNLDALMALDRGVWQALRQWASACLSTSADASTVDAMQACLIDQGDVEMLMPATIGDYTDFYASVFHATNVGSLFRPDNPLLPNYKYVPIGYHGRASTIVASGTEVKRPCGQRKSPDEAVPTYGPCRLLDYEMEVGLWIGGAANARGDAISIDDAEDRLFGVCLLNDWSARDLQAWEYQPLGPFLAKSFASSISPWIVTMEALAPFRCAEFERPEGDPEVLPYLRSSNERPGFDMQVQVFLASEAMRAEGTEQKLSETTVANLYWTPEQMVTHHASNGCDLNPGDLLGTGTVSGPESGELGSLLEITRRGANPLALSDGTERKMLNDGDEVIMRGFCAREGAVRVGFGECRGVVSAAEQS